VIEEVEGGEGVSGSSEVRSETSSRVPALARYCLGAHPSLTFTSVRSHVGGTRLWALSHGIETVPTYVLCAYRLLQ
jgi:hypothetical protein